MQGSLESCPKRKPRTKWTEDEQARLKEAVEEIQPESNNQWRQVSLRMHQWGSRRTQQQYKLRRRGGNYLPRNQRQQIKLTEELFDLIFMRFDQGVPVQTLLQDYATSFQNRACIQNRITQRFHSLAKITRAIDSQAKVRKLAYRDYRFLGFVRRQGLQLPSLVEILCHCERLRLIGRPRNEQEKAEIHDIQLAIKRYNDLLLKHTQAFMVSESAKPGNINRSNACRPTVPYMYLTLAANETSKRQKHSQQSESFLAQYNAKRLQSLMTMQTMQTIGDQDEMLSDFHSPCVLGTSEEAEFELYWNEQSAN